MECRPGALYKALLALAGHFLAMLMIWLPFSLRNALLAYKRPLRIGVGIVVIALGLWLIITRKHPRCLACILASRLALWSFAVMIAHRAALRLVLITRAVSA